MPFEPGNKAAVGADHKKPRIITQKLIAELQHADGARLQKVVQALVTQAEGGDVTAIREIMDRVEGKPTQPIGGDADQPFKLVVEWKSKGD